MMRTNSLVIGLAVGAVVPVLAYVLVESLLATLGTLGVTNPEGDAIAFKQRTTALLAICANLLPFYRFNTRFTEATMRGVLIATAAYVVMWFVTFGIPLLTGAIE